MKAESKVFVTGTTGLIGTWLVQSLLDRGHSVRALIRRTPPLPPPYLGWDGTGGPLAHKRVELVRGDITDRDSIVKGMLGCDYVFHLAAYVKNWARDKNTFFESNVQGLRNILDVADEQNVSRVVWTSTVMTLGPTTRGTITNEETLRSTNKCFTEYEATKLQAEREAIQRAKDGFPVVIVNPTKIYGPGYLTESNSLTALIDNYDQGKVPILPNFGINIGNYVFVHDVVRGHIQAMEKGRVGQRYILGGENASLKQFFHTISKVSGKRHLQIPIFRLAPMAFAYCHKWRADLFGIYPTITPGWVKTFFRDWASSTKKAETELGYRPTPLAEGIQTTLEWLQKVRNQQQCNSNKRGISS